jgi:cobalt-zinc-cadmium efflux system outer membrane protein
MAVSFDPAFSGDYNLLVTEVLKNYQKRNIGLLEFLDYYDSFKQNVLQTNALKLNRINAYEQLNFAVGRDIL